LGRAGAGVAQRGWAADGPWGAGSVSVASVRGPVESRAIASALGPGSASAAVCRGRDTRARAPDGGAGGDLAVEADRVRCHPARGYRFGRVAARGLQLRALMGDAPAQARRGGVMIRSRPLWQIR